MIAETVLQQAQMESHARLLAIQKAWDAYNGQLAKPLKVLPGNPDDNVRVNFARGVVDEGVAALFGDDLIFEVTGTDGEDDLSASAKASDAKLRAFWKQNRRMTTLTKLGVNGAVTGDAFFRMVQPGPGQGCPRLLVLDPATVTPVWANDDYEDVLWYVIQWNSVDPYTRKPQANRQVIEKGEGGTYWTITDYVSIGDRPDFQQVGDEEIWDFAHSPIFHCQNLPAANCYFGVPDLEEDTIDVNVAINLTTSNIQRILRYHAHPKTWGRGIGNKDLQTRPDNMLLFQNEAAELHNLEMQSDLKSSLDFYRLLKEGFHVVARHPEIATGKLDQVGQLSGLAMQILYRPLSQKTKTKRLTYGEMLDDLNSFALEFMGEAAEQACTTHWPDVLPTDSKEEADTAIELNTLGVSKDTLLTRLGYDAELEAEKSQKEQKSAAEMGATMLDQFGRGQLPSQAPGAGNPKE